MHVLLPVDTDEERAVAAARSITAWPHAAEDLQVTILNVAKKLKVAGGEGGHIDSNEWYDEDDFPDAVAAAAEVLEADGVTVDRKRIHADPGEAIIDFAEEVGADHIVMAGRKRTPVGKVLFGSVTQSVLLNSSVPVTVVPG